MGGIAPGGRALSVGESKQPEYSVSQGTTIAGQQDWVRLPDSPHDALTICLKLREQRGKPTRREAHWVEHVILNHRVRVQIPAR